VVCTRAHGNVMDCAARTGRQRGDGAPMPLPAHDLATGPQGEATHAWLPFGPAHRFPTSRALRLASALRLPRGRLQRPSAVQGVNQGGGNEGKAGDGVREGRIRAFLRLQVCRNAGSCAGIQQAAHSSGWAGTSLRSCRPFQPARGVLLVMPDACHEPGTLQRDRVSCPCRMSPRN